MATLSDYALLLMKTYLMMKKDSTPKLIWLMIPWCHLLRIFAKYVHKLAKKWKK